MSTNREKAEIAAKSTKIRAVVFDMDGLMFNTEDIYNEVGAIVLRRRGCEFTQELKLKMMGLPGSRAYKVMRLHCDLNDSVEQLAKESDEVFEEILEDRIQKMPGLDRLLDELEAANLPKAVATSSSRRFAEKALGTFNLIPRFEFVLTGEDVVNGKPAPDIYLLAAKKLDIPIEQVLILEDSPIGSRAGASSGAVTIAVPNSHTAGSDFSHVNLVAESLIDPKITEVLFGSRQ